LEMCFVAGTPIHTIDGLRPIETIAAGQSVLCSDPAALGKSSPVYKLVLRTFVTHPDRLYHVTIQRDDGFSETLGTTAEHPFFVSQRNEFVPAAELQVGDQLILASGGRAQISDIRIEKAAGDATFTTYNFEVADQHTYFVGQSGVWVHNISKAFCNLLGKTYTKAAERIPTAESKAKAAKKTAELLIKKAAGDGTKIDETLDHLRKVESLGKEAAEAIEREVRKQLRDVATSKNTRVIRTSNPKHHPNSVSPEPKNVQELFDRSVVDDKGVRWVKDSDGVIHRFSAPSNGESHWNGSTSGVDPIRIESISNKIRELLK
ncbi:MAG: Hint domain-containing protein, partial [Planctomycetes bacterium]|nr:Hint domain-containing protein [Planctomycetota bacterium]